MSLYQDHGLSQANRRQIVQLRMTTIGQPLIVVTAWHGVRGTCLAVIRDGNCEHDAACNEGSTTKWDSFCSSQVTWQGLGSTDPPRSIG